MNIVRLHLDWTPNTNHIGFYIAQELGLFEQAEIKLVISHPGEDNYVKTPARKLADSEVNIALSPTESLFSYATRSSKTNTTNSEKIVAIGAVLQSDASSIVVNNSSITRPKNLDGTVYGSYQAKYEDLIVKELIRSDGGSGDIEIIYPPKLEIWDYLQERKIDSTWIFLPWEGLLRKRQCGELISFSLKDYNIPYSYSPLILSSKDWIDNNQETAKAFLEVSATGWKKVSEDPLKSAKILTKFISDSDYSDINFLVESIELLLPSVFDNQSWGQIKEEKISSFKKWLVDTEYMPRNFKESLININISDYIYNL